MSGHDRLRVLRGVQELSGIPEPRLGALLGFFDEFCVPAGVMLAREGRLAHELFVVAEGELEACRQSRAWRLGPGDAFGWKAMHERRCHDATLVTISAARLLVMSHSQFRAVDGVAPASTNVQPVTS